MNWVWLTRTAILGASGLGDLTTRESPGRDAREVRRVAIIGCHQQPRPAPALERYVAARPDVVLWVGDNVDVPHVLFRCFDTETNALELTYRVNLHELAHAD